MKRIIIEFSDGSQSSEEAVRITIPAFEVEQKSLDKQPKIAASLATPLDAGAAPNVGAVGLEPTLNLGEAEPMPTAIEKGNAFNAGAAPQSG